MKKLFRFPAPTRCSLVPAFLVIVAVAGCSLAPSGQIQAPPSSAVGANLVRAQASEVEHSQKFAGWVAEFRTSARAAGIDEATLQIALDDVRLVPRVIELDQKQPEFTRPVWDYLDNALSMQRIARGQDKLLQL